MTDEGEWMPYNNNFPKAEIAILSEQLYWTHEYAPEPISRNERILCSTTTNDHCPNILPKTLAQQWGIGIETASHTLRYTTQLGLQNQLSPLPQRFRMRQA